MNTPNRRNVVTSYLEHLNRHDVTGALDHLALEYQMQFTNGPTLTREALANSLGWDAGTNGQIEWRFIPENTGEVAVEGTEINAFLRLLGMAPLSFRSRFRVNQQGLITHQQHTVDWPTESVDDALAPAIVWAQQHAPDVLAEAYPGARMVYSEATGRLWVKLLQQWRDASALE